MSGEERRPDRPADARGDVAPMAESAPAGTVTVLPHPSRYPLAINGQWRATCRCHWWQPIGPVLGVERAA